MWFITSFSQGQFLRPFVLAPSLFLKVTNPVEFELYFLDWNNKAVDAFRWNFPFCSVTRTFENGPLQKPSHAKSHGIPILTSALSSSCEGCLRAPLTKFC